MALLCCRQIELFILLHQGADPIGARALRHGALQAADDLADPRRREGAGRNRRSARRLFVEGRAIHVAKSRQRQRSGDRRRGHHEHVDGRALRAKRQTLLHAETMLFVDDGEAKIMERQIALHQRMRADDDVDFAGADGCVQRRAFARLGAAGEEREPQTGRLEQRRETIVMLTR